MLYETGERKAFGEKEWLESIGYHKGITIRILELFEEMLEEKNITIPDSDRCGDSNEARLYGCTYGYLEDQIEAMLKEYFPIHGVSIHTINLDEFLERFNKEYQFLYDNHDNVAGFDEALEAGNEFIRMRPDFISQFVSYRGEPLTSDREVVAFAFVLVDMTE